MRPKRAWMGLRRRRNCDGSDTPEAASSGVLHVDFRMQGHLGCFMPLQRGHVRLTFMRVLAQAVLKAPEVERADWSPSSDQKIQRTSENAKAGQEPDQD